MNNQKNFYQGTRLVTLFQANEQTSLVRVRGGILAQAVMRSNNCVVELLTVDAQRSVKQVSSVLAASINYTPYGYFQKNNILSPLAYTGERLDQASQCYLLGNGRRSYSPVLQRFLSPDPLSPFSSGGLNSYVYCLGDPVNFSDPSGLSAWSWFKSKLSKHVLTKVPGFKSAIRKARQQEQEGYKGREQEHLRSLESERSKSSALRAEVTGLKTKMANLEADLKRYDLANGAKAFEMEFGGAQSSLLNRAFELMGAPNVPAELMLPKPNLSKFGWEKDDSMILFLEQRNRALRARDEVLGIISAGVRSS